MDLPKDSAMRFFEGRAKPKTLEERTAHISDPELRDAAIGMAERIKRETDAKIAKGLAKRDHLAIGKAMEDGYDKTQAYIDRMARIADNIAQKRHSHRTPEREQGRER